MAFTIRKTTMNDLPRVMEIYAQARDFMVEQGNPHQWAETGWPPEEVIRKDIEAGDSYVCEAEGKVVGVFYYIFGDHIDATYDHIEDGAWAEDSPYGVIHRIATDRSQKGAGAHCIRWGIEKSGGHLRMDTHGDNKPMQKLMSKLGMEHRGTIFVEEDDYPRMAYEIVGKGNRSW